MLEKARYLSFPERIEKHLVENPKFQELMISRVQLNCGTVYIVYKNLYINIHDSKGFLLGGTLLSTRFWNLDNIAKKVWIIVKERIQNFYQCMPLSHDEIALHKRCRMYMYGDITRFYKTNKTNRLNVEGLNNARR